MKNLGSYVWAILFALACLIEIAAAQTPTPAGVINYGQSVGWLQPYIQDLVAAIIAIIGTWLLWLLKNKIGIEIDKTQAEVYLRAAKNQASSLIADGFVKVAENGKVTVDDKDLAAAANVLLKAVPDAAAHFDIKLHDVKDKIIDMIPQVPAVEAVVQPVPVAKKR